jgi:hypothetical protein
MGRETTTGCFTKKTSETCRVVDATALWEERMKEGSDIGGAHLDQTLP